MDLSLAINLGAPFMAHPEQEEVHPPPNAEGADEGGPLRQELASRLSLDDRQLQQSD